MTLDVSVVNCVASGIWQMDLVMWIVSERDVFTTQITRYGKSLCYGGMPYTYDEVLFYIVYHKFAVSRRYSKDTREIQ